MDSKLADILFPLTWALTRVGGYLTRKSEDWRVSLIEKYKRW
jgi:hypothetical protein